MTELQSVRSAIERAFTDAVYPGDWCLTNSREGTEPALLEQEFKGKADWRLLEPAFLDRAPDGYGTALNFFSDEAFRFYLPAYLLADLDGKLQQADVVFALTHGLDRASRARRINPRRYGERTWFDHARHKFSMFGAREVAAIVSYLRYKLESDLTADEQERIREALATYWERVQIRGQ